MNEAGSELRALRDYPVIDVDVHIHEDFAEIAKFAEPDLRRSIEIEKSPEAWLDTPGYSPLTVYDPPLGEKAKREVHLIRNSDQLRTDLDQMGIDAAIVYTGRLLGTATRQEASYAVGMMHAYNDYLVKNWLNPERGIYGAIMIAAQDPKASALEIERLAHTDGFVSAYLPMANVYPLWGHRQYDPIYAAAQSADLPVVLQGYTQVYPVFPHQFDQFDTALAKQVLSKPFGAMANLVSIITTGALARFPNLKVVFTECGVSWLPFILRRLDRQYHWLREEVPFYTSNPSQHLRHQVFLTTHSLEETANPVTLAALLTDDGLADQILFATDWPHYDADSVNSIQGLPLPEPNKRKILSDNALRTFRFSKDIKIARGSRKASS